MKEVKHRPHIYREEFGVDKKVISKDTVPQRAIALFAGFAFMIMTVAAIFANFMVIERLKVSGDAAATANNILASVMLFRMGICSLIVVLICDIAVAWALYVFLKPVNKSISLLAAWFRLVYSAILGVALLNLVFVLYHLNGAEYLTVFNTAQLHAQVLLFINAFTGIWSIGLVIFGFHLLVLGYLVFKATYIPKILGVLLVIAAFGYMITNLAIFLIPDYDNYKTLFELILGVPMAVGELALAFWLLFKGGK